MNKPSIIDLDCVLSFYVAEESFVSINVLFELDKLIACIEVALKLTRVLVDGDVEIFKLNLAAADDYLVNAPGHSSL